MRKQGGTMNLWRHMLFACVAFMLTIQVYSLDSNDIPFKIIDNYQEKRAVCIDGTPGGYYFSPGSGEGAKNWLLFLLGGGWCWKGLCAQRAREHQWNGSTRDAVHNKYAHFGGLLSTNQTLNPDFHNWNRVLFWYCDGASFFGDNDAVDNGTYVQLRGSRIYNSIMEELLQKGLGEAENAILSGSSAGGLATILHCDEFRALLPNAKRLKCLSDGGFFLHGKNLPYDWRRENMYKWTVEIHNLTSYLPKYCTSKMDAGLCLFPEYSISSIKTPLFILNSGFDWFQIADSLTDYPAPADWARCTGNLSRCTPDQTQIIRDFGRKFVETLESKSQNSTGLLINSCYLHGMMDFDDKWDNKAYGLGNMTIRQAFSDWYFDRSSIKLITQDKYITACG